VREAVITYLEDVLAYVLADPTPGAEIEIGTPRV